MLTTKNRPASDVVTPVTGKSSVFVSDTKVLTVKDDTGTVTPIGIPPEVVTLPEQGSDPSTAADQQKLYTKDVSGSNESFLRPESSGTPIQLTRNGGLKSKLVVAAGVSSSVGSYPVTFFELFKYDISTDIITAVLPSGVNGEEVWLKEVGLDTGGAAGSFFVQTTGGQNIEDPSANIGTSFEWGVVGASFHYIYDASMTRWHLLDYWKPSFG